MWDENLVSGLAGCPLDNGFIQREYDCRKAIVVSGAMASKRLLRPYARQDARSAGMSPRLR